MAKVILWGGGDGGGIIIGPNGIKPIPPFDPAIFATLKTIAAVQRVQQVLAPDVQREAAAFTAKLASFAVAGVQKAAGAIDADAGLVFQDGDGGFTCGSTGKPPIPLPRPAVRLPQRPIVTT